MFYLDLFAALNRHQVSYVLIGGLGDDSLIGGAGVDTASYATATENLTISLAAGSQSIGSFGTDSFSEIENLTTGSGNDSLTGGDGADSLLGLTERLDRLVDLVDVFGEDVLIGDERMMMVDLVRSTCMELSPLIRSKGVSIVFNGDKDDLPPIYGSGRLIRRALLECIHNAVLHARSEINPSQQVGVEIGFRASGQHLLVGHGLAVCRTQAKATLHGFAHQPAHGPVGQRQSGRRRCTGQGSDIESFASALIACSTVERWL